MAAFNPKSSDYVRKKYKQKLQKFEETCNLIRYLGDNMTVRYRDPNERPADFDSKLEVFFALKGIEPTATWMSWMCVCVWWKKFVMCSMLAFSFVDFPNMRGMNKLPSSWSCLLRSGFYLSTVGTANQCCWHGLWKCALQSVLIYLQREYVAATCQHCINSNDSCSSRLTCYHQSLTRVDIDIFPWRTSEIFVYASAFLCRI